MRGTEVRFGDQVFHALAVSHELMSTPFAVDFEETERRLAELERLFIEPDGSFVWTSPAEGPKWQVDGNLFDRAGRLLFVDLKGTCPEEYFNQLLAAVGWPTTPVMFQLVRAAVFLDELEFRRWANASS
jgi:hypothetical protein